MISRKVLGFGIGLGMSLFILFLLVTLIFLRYQIFNLAFDSLDMRYDDKKIEKALQTLSETGQLPQSIEPDLELFIVAFCSYHGKSPATYEQRFIPANYIKALKSLRLLIKNHPTSFVRSRAFLAVDVYIEVGMRLERKPDILLELKCDEETFMAEFYAQFSIANAYGDRLTDAADSFFINGEYRKAFLYFRRRGLRAGAIYCYEYGVGTTQLPKILIW
ncbi:MAG: hypothetical protein RR328_07180, partial [Bacteroidales bacterium]